MTNCGKRFIMSEGQCGDWEGDEQLLCVSCRDRAAAKASAPTVELAEGWRPSRRVDTFNVCRRCDVSYTAGQQWYTSPGYAFHCSPCAEVRGAFASLVTDARKPEPVVCAHVGYGRTSPHVHARKPHVGCVQIGCSRTDVHLHAPPIEWPAPAPLPQWLTDERALMQAAPPTQVLPEFPRSRIERDNLHLRPQFQRSPRYSRKGTP